VRNGSWGSSAAFLCTFGAGSRTQKCRTAILTQRRPSDRLHNNNNDTDAEAPVGKLTKQLN